MSHYSSNTGTSKNPPWQQQITNVQQLTTQPQNMINTNLLQYPQAALIQAQAQQIIQQSTLNTATNHQYNNTPNVNTTAFSSIAITPGAVTYPTRQLNSTAFISSNNLSNNTVVNPLQQTNNIIAAGIPKQRVFTGTVTKRQQDFGFIDGDVFFQNDACAKGSSPGIGDKVLVEAAYNPSMPYQWNATRIQVLPMEIERNKPASRFSSTANPTNTSFSDFRRNDNRRNDNNRRNNFASRKSPDRKRRHDSSPPRSRTPKKDDKEKEKSPRKSRSRSPKRRRTKPTPRYAVSIPKFALDLSQADLLELRRRYSNMYIPSDFFITSSTWLEAFPPDRPFSLQHPCNFHIFSKEVPSYITNDAVLDPPDMNYLFSAKVMLLSMPQMEDVFKKTVTLSEDMDKDYKDSVHPSRLINFLVGIRGKNETMAIGGPWSESLDGPNPDKDPSVLIKTAVRTTKALTGIDLSKCTKWYRFVELYYRRAETTSKGKVIPQRVETVVIFLPDIWNCKPTQLEWDGLHVNYTKLYNKKINPPAEPTGAVSNDDDKDASMDLDTSVVKREPTHYSLLDIKVMKVQDLREELEARNLSSKGLKSQLTARLAKALKSEQEADDAKGEAEEEEAATAAEVKAQEETPDGDDNIDNKVKGLSEKEKEQLEKKYKLPESPCILVHPSATAKSGKFNCEIMSLSLLLDYRIDDTKEHSFEVSVFAELFNEMLMRDCGFQIFKAIHNAPEKIKEGEKEKKEKSIENDKEGKDDIEKSDKSKDEKDKKNNEDDKKSDKDKKESRDKDKRRGDKENEKDKQKMYTENPFLLLCCSYFDTSHIGYFYDKDLEDLLLTLGLSLSRSQVKKLSQKVLTRDSFHYRKLTDKPVVDGIEKTTNFEIKLDIDTLKQLIEGNRKFLPIFNNSSSSSGGKKTGTPSKGEKSSGESGLIMYQGCFIDIGNLQASLEKSDSARNETETLLAKLRLEYADLEKSSKKTKDKLEKVSTELNEKRSELNSVKDELKGSKVKVQFVLTAINEIHKQTTSVKEDPFYINIMGGGDRRSSSSSSSNRRDDKTKLKNEIVENNTDKIENGKKENEKEEKEIKNVKEENETGNEKYDPTEEMEEEEEDFVETEELLIKEEIID